MTVYGFFPSAAAILLKLLLAWKTSPVCRKTNSPSPPTPSSIPSGRVCAPCCQRTRMCSAHSQFHFSYRSLELTINLKEPDVFPKYPICLSLVMKLFSSCFLCLSLISAINPQAQSGAFSFFPLCFIHMPSLNENSIVQEIYVMLTSHLVW